MFCLSNCIGRAHASISIPARTKKGSLRSSGGRTTSTPFNTRSEGGSLSLKRREMAQRTSMTSSTTAPRPAFLRHGAIPIGGALTTPAPFWSEPAPHRPEPMGERALDRTGQSLISRISAAPSTRRVGDARSRVAPMAICKPDLLKTLGTRINSRAPRAPRRSLSASSPACRALRSAMVCPGRRLPRSGTCCGRPDRHKPALPAAPSVNGSATDRI
ncbi:hypothetical protein SAMN05444161_1065 [Rhizobiales bacterium GAS191]|nr:hypothetical protein SAMN05444161_1065 [Rhizobiales bacterium GAS191]